ncbi:MAG: sigma-70 family RNA polymerase sigma factor [Gemmatimonadota bacterium]|nr:sigma-70 family RNA polymerase sigma factor [Gemmatimonadota bacterium]
MREQDIERYLHHILKSLKPTCLSQDDEEDILQEGRQAYWKAERNFDNTKDCKLTTYAYPRVRGAMIRMIIKTAGPIHLSEHSQRNGKDKPEYFRIDAEEHRDGDMMPEQLHTNESEEIDMRLDTQRILDKLSSKDRVLIERYYGIGRQQYTFEEIARLEGLSRAAIHKRHKRIISDVRNQLKIVTSNRL